MTATVVTIAEMTAAVPPRPAAVTATIAEMTAAVPPRPAAVTATRPATETGTTTGTAAVATAALPRQGVKSLTPISKCAVGRVIALVLRESVSVNVSARPRAGMGMGTQMMARRSRMMRRGVSVQWGLRWQGDCVGVVEGGW
jgi:hypothetical protein